MQVQKFPMSVAVDSAHAMSRPRAYSWLVFIVVYALMLADYMSRQALNAVFPQLKAQWALSDAQLGLLSGIVGLAVGLLAVPAALLADRWGRVKSVVIMALFWSVSTLACGLAEHYNQLLLARLFVGVGEAGYGSVGLAIILSVFPSSMRATITGVFTSGGMFGAVLGMASSGVIATHYGWRASLIVMAVFGFLLVLLFAFTITEPRLARHMPKQPARSQGVGNQKIQLRSLFTILFGKPTLVFTYLGSGLQLFTAYTIIAWMPSYLNRYYDLPADKSALAAAALLITSGVGMGLCGMFTGWMGRKSDKNKPTLAILYCLGSCVLLMVSMRLPPGTGQFAVIMAGVFFAAGTYGSAGAMVTDLVHFSLHGTAIATLALAGNLLGGAPGPYLTGLLADSIGLLSALQWVPLVSIGAALAFAFARANYVRDLRQHESASCQ
ncbi:MFS transporter [Pseudomonas putida]